MEPDPKSLVPSSESGNNQDAQIHPKNDGGDNHNHNHQPAWTIVDFIKKATPVIRVFSFMAIAECLGLFLEHFADVFHGVFVELANWISLCLQLLVVAVPIAKWFRMPKKWVWIPYGIVCLAMLLAIFVPARQPANSVEPKTVELKAPQIHIVSSPIGMPAAGESPLSLASIQSRRLRKLAITNPNDFPISVQFHVQFPEAIVSMKSEHALEANPHWLPMTRDVKTSGAPASDSIFIEPFATNELTGLWKLTMDSLPKNSSTTIDIVTVTGHDAGLFGSWTSHFGGPGNEHLWYVSGNFRSIGEPNTNALNIFIPMKYDRQDRSITAFPTEGQPAFTNYVHLMQASGFRIPGIVTIGGYLEVVVSGNPMWIADFMSESSNAVVNIGISQDLMPAIEITMTNGTVIHIGRSPPVFFSQFTNGIFYLHK
jgi:hypothetical protein